MRKSLLYDAFLFTEIHDLLRANCCCSSNFSLPSSVFLQWSEFFNHQCLDLISVSYGYGDSTKRKKFLLFNCDVNISEKHDKTFF